jgi:Ankyrin repeat
MAADVAAALLSMLDGSQEDTTSQEGDDETDISSRRTKLDIPCGSQLETDLCAGNLHALGRIVFKLCEFDQTNDAEFLSGLLDVATAHNVLKAVLEWKDPAWSGTPLDNAAQNGSTALVRVLVDFGADPNAKNDAAPTLTGYSLSAATNNGHGATVEALLLGGADPYHTGCMDEKHSPLQESIRNQREDCSTFRAYMRAGVDLSVAQDDGSVPLEVAMADEALRPIVEQYLGSRTKSARKH